MASNRYITYLLFLISIIMLEVPVIPHHHHTNGMLCMKNDLSANCCETQPSEHHKHCCHTKCVATHFFKKTPATEDGIEITPSAESSLYLPAVFLPQSDALSFKPIHKPPFYIESLHGTHIARASGLRAPPCVLA